MVMITEHELSLKFFTVRRAHKLTLRDVEIQTGISPSTLGRFENEIGMLDSDHFFTIAHWLRVPLNVEPTDTAETFERIKGAIEADGFLTEDAKDGLFKLMRAAYDHALEEK